MAIGVIELRPKACYDDTQWVPAAVGNITRPSFIRFCTNKGEKTKVGEFKVMNFLKCGRAADSDRVSDLLRYDAHAPFLHRHARAIGCNQRNAGWQKGAIDNDDIRLVEFNTIEELNTYMTDRKIKCAAKATVSVNKVVLPQGEQTVQELYQELAKVMAKDPKAAAASVVKCTGSVATETLTDDEALKQTSYISASLLQNAIEHATARIEKQANDEVQRIYNELGASKAPTIKLTATVALPVPKATK